MSKYPRVILMVGLAVLLLASMATVVDARTTYTTSKPVLSGPPHKDKTFTASGVITPKSTAKSRAKVKIILWMEYGDDDWGVMRTYWAKLSARPAGKPGTKYACAINIPMKGDHGVQAVQYRNGKQVSKSRTIYFTVQP
jgi:hypothetical protein